jgi:SAM-dependent methyltransferase
LAGLSDFAEAYGAHVVREFLERARPFDSVLDIGAGSGRDLASARDVQPNARRLAVEIHPGDELRAVADEILAIDIEREALPFEDGSVELVMANQVLEHIKEIYWLFHQITRVLPVGGHALIGVPNVASFHNRGLLLLGRQPTQHKLYSAHVRVFSRRDTERFLEVCWPGGYEIVAFGGSQFYPFPRGVARRLCRAFPGAAFAIFWLLRKTKPYHGEFLEHPVRAQLETPFYLGPTR